MVFCVPEVDVIVLLDMVPLGSDVAGAPDANVVLLYVLPLGSGVAGVIDANLWALSTPMEKSFLTLTVKVIKTPALD